MLCLEPTLELAEQTASVIESLAKHMPGFRIARAVKGAFIEQGQQAQGQIIVGTPGKTKDWLGRRAFDAASIRLFVLDEADVMLEMQGLGDQTQQITRRLPNPPLCQLAFFSATFNDKVTF